MVPEISSYINQETEAREMNFLSAPFPFPVLLLSSGKVEIVSCSPKSLHLFLADVARLHFPASSAVR
jgi:hypothetical protein